MAWAGASTTHTDLGGDVVGPPSGCLGSDGRLHVFATAKSGNQILAAEQITINITGFSALTDIGGDLSGAPAKPVTAVTVPHLLTIDVFYRATTNQARYASQTDRNPSGEHAEGSPMTSGENNAAARNRARTGGHDILGSDEVVDDTMNTIQPLFGSGSSVDMNPAYFAFTTRPSEPEFVIKLEDDKLIAHARMVLSDGDTYETRVGGRIAKEKTDYNPN